MTPTRAYREAFAREYWPGGVARGTSGDVWIETGRGGNPAWDHRRFPWASSYSWVLTGSKS